MQGTPIDLDGELAEIDLSPVTVKLGGRKYKIRRDLTGKEVLEFWQLLVKLDDAAAFSILVGPEDGPQLNEHLDSLPQKRRTKATRRLTILAELRTEADFAEGKPGESSASSRP
jgi:hypothetical protein